jgi:hypothetical protein
VFHVNFLPKVRKHVAANVPEFGKLMMSQPRVQKVISGGQTGVDRAALDVANYLELEHGGWCPSGRRAEDGQVPKIYRLKPTRSSNYAVRTEKNVIEADGTCILFRRVMTGGTELTRRLAMKHNRPLICIDLQLADQQGQAALRDWIVRHGIRVLNVAGPRESTCPGIVRETEQFLLGALKPDSESI